LIIGIKGRVVNKEPTFVDIECSSGLTYRVLISLYSSSLIEKETSLHTTYVVKEDSQKLFGFVNSEEKEIFDRVLKINGVGPSTALAICSTLSPNDFFKALSSGDIDAFKKVPGIGPKSAKRILVELSDFMPKGDENSSESDDISKKAGLALESLGFKKDAIKKAIKKCSSESVEEMIKEALKILR